MEGVPGTSRSSLRSCVIHTDSKEGDPVKPFTQATLDKCRHTLRIRMYHSLIYNNFKLPSDVNDESKGFHYSCYKKFTAISKKYVDTTPDCVLSLPSNITLAPPPALETRARSVPVLEGVIFKKICMFCKKARKMYNKKPQKLRQCLTKEFEKKIVRAASVLNDTRILALAELGNFSSKEFMYHPICDKRYRNKVAQLRTASSSWHFCRERHKESLEYICEIVENDILKDEKIYTMTELTKLYNIKLNDPMPVKGIEEIKPSRLELKLLLKYPSALLVDKSHSNHIFFKSSLNLSAQNLDNKLKELAENSELRDAAFKLRNHIISNDTKPIPNTNLSIDHIFEGDCNIPPTLRTFVENVVYGPKTSRNNDSYDRRINSICSDLIFATTNGRVCPSKQLMLGCVAKTLTGSKKLINILNRLGCSVSYSTVEEVETELSYSSYYADSLVPSNIVKVPTLYTSVAFNNFDRFVDTLTGKDTLHDTVGIIFQNFDEAAGPSREPTLPQHSSDGLDEGKNPRKRRRFEATITDLPPYPKKPVFKLLNGVILNPFTELEDFTSHDFRSIDIMWMLNFAYSQPQTPMWSGFNARHCIDQSPQQKIAYLPQINHSPTSYAVVRHTLVQALRIADECNQEEIMCTYDLNIAKMAMEIQSEDKPSFDRVFIMLGPFHVEMAWFKAIGKYIDGSGVVEVLIEKCVLAQGSVTGFLGGSNYNRCKRIHRLLALALRSLHYKQFKKNIHSDDGDHPEDVYPDDTQDGDDIPYLLSEAQDLRIIQGMDNINLNPTLQDHIKKYLDFEQKTLRGDHGKTPQIWMTYIHFMDTYNDFVRSTRMGDINLFLKSIMQIADLFFAMNHQNYARWLTPFIDNIIHSLKSDGYIGQQLKNGFFSVKRTDQNFSKTPIDLTLEQTINADAANKLTGVVSSTNSISARQRWAYSHSQRTEVVSGFLRELGINAQEDVHTDLRPGRIQHDTQAYVDLVSTIQGMINPFDPDLDVNYLFNICTGKSTSDDVYHFLQQVPEAGRTQHLRFREECNTDNGRFYRPLKKNKVTNFASQNAKFTVTKADKTAVITLERNLLGRLLAISLKEKIDLAAVLSFPLTPIPLSLGRADGSLVKTQKSVLLKILEGASQSPHTRSTPVHEIPTQVDVAIVDGFYFMHLKGSHFPSSYGGIAHEILKKLSIYKSRSVHLIFDRYPAPSIKDLERKARSGSARPLSGQSYSIMNPEQKRPNNFIKALRDENYKQSLVTFLFEEWKKNEYLEYFKSFSLYLTVGESCYLYMSLREEVLWNEVESLRSGHEEADSRMVYHLISLEYGNVVIHTCDTDVLIIILGNLHLMNNSINVWMETGTMARNDHRFINVRKVADNIGPLMCKSLPGFHAFTGSDYTSSFFRIGKNKPYNILKKDPKFQKMFVALGDGLNLDENEFRLLQEFVCKMYSRKEIHNVNELRLHLFMDVYNKRSTTEPLKATKGIDNMSLPPCGKTLRNHILRAKYVTMLWTNVKSATPPPHTPEDFGWELEYNQYKVAWFQGPALPKKLEEILLSDESPEETSLTDPEESNESEFSTSDEE